MVFSHCGNRFLAALLCSCPYLAVLCTLLDSSNIQNTNEKYLKKNPFLSNQLWQQCPHMQQGIVLMRYITFCVLNVEWISTMRLTLPKLTMRQEMERKRERDAGFGKSFAPLLPYSLPIAPMHTPISSIFLPSIRHGLQLAPAANSGAGRGESRCEKLQGCQ